MANPYPIFITVGGNVLVIILLAQRPIQRLTMLTVECGERNCRVRQGVDAETLEFLVLDSLVLGHGGNTREIISCVVANRPSFIENSSGKKGE